LICLNKSEVNSRGVVEGEVHDVEGEDEWPERAVAGSTLLLVLGLALYPGRVLVKAGADAISFEVELTLAGRLILFDHEGALLVVGRSSEQVLERLNQRLWISSLLVPFVLHLFVGMHRVIERLRVGPLSFGQSGFDDVLSVLVSDEVILELRDWDLGKHLLPEERTFDSVQH
jgi:hypothetical protein